MPKILVAEDDNLTRITLGQFLRGKGYEVELAEDGAQAIALFKQNDFDLVVSDVVMPQVNGWNLSEHVRSISPDMPVLLMTAYGRGRSREAPAHGTPEVILKPLVLTELLSKIQQLLDQKKL
jgi:CheY-like chemotaxis protein